MSSAVIKEDGFNQSRQQQLGAGITSIANALSAVLKLEDDKIDPNLKELLIEHLGDEERLLIDSFYELSMTRRSFITPSLSLTAKNVTDSCKVDSLLFGQDFAEKYKGAVTVKKDGKSMAKTASSFKKPTTRFDSSKNRFLPQRRSGNYLNLKGSHRGKSFHSGGSQQQQKQRTNIVQNQQRTRR